MGKKKPKGTPADRFRKIPLWQWGIFVIIAGVMANLVMGMLPSPTDSAAARGQAFGRGLATVLAVVVGISLIAVHFVRRNR